REALGLHTAPFLEGPVAIQGDLSGRQGQLAGADIALDLTGSTVALGLVGINKAAGIAAKGHVIASFGPGSALKTEEIRFSSADGSLDAQMSFGKDGALEQLSLPGVKYGAANDFSLRVMRSALSTDVSIRGHSLDGTGIAHEGAGGGGSSNPNDKYFDGAYHVSARLDRVVLRSGVTITPFTLDVSGTGAHMNSMALAGVLDRGGKITGKVSPAPARRAVFNVDDAGELTRGLLGWGGMKGGKLEIVANFPPAEPAAKETAGPDFQGKLALSDATFVNQPFLARMLGMISFVGLGNLLSGSGLVMDHLDVPFVSKNGIISIHDAAASGPTIGLTADGYIDRSQNTVALKGSLVPVVGVDFNKVLGAIPLVGNILVSKKGEGIFGVTYSVQGNADQPSVTVNPLAMLTPGILRRLFVGKIPVPPSSAQSAQAPVKPAGPEPK
ncbi:MAG: AsmA-like C-terminal domain-containing protein, partial [Alphaproteobacteria bacterium]|nr:AsmA-like C-terminal domain-containing protein [Alphaproteobacteria bacterium]